jgi:thiamine kinase
MATQAPGAVALALVPGWQPGEQPLHLQSLEGGSVNDVWRVDTRSGRYVLRIDGAEWRRPGVDRRRELPLHRAAAAAGLAPRIVATSAALDAWVMEYIDARRWREEDFADARQLERLGETLAALHRLPLPAIGPEAAAIPGFAPVAIARAYGQLALERKPESARHVTRLEQRVRQAEQQLAARSNGLAMVHGDPAANNVLGGQRLWLVDWEYAQIADPVFDAAAVLVYHPAARAHLQRLLQACGQESALHDGRLQWAAQIHDSLGWLWRLARGENVPDDAGNWRPEWAN